MKFIVILGLFKACRIKAVITSNGKAFKLFVFYVICNVNKPCINWFLLIQYKTQNISSFRQAIGNLIPVTCHSCMLAQIA